MIDFKPKPNTHRSIQKWIGHVTIPKVAARRLIIWLFAMPLDSAVWPKEIEIVSNYKLYSIQINNISQLLKNQYK